jgi:hypothetical protein
MIIFLQSHPVKELIRKMSFSVAIFIVFSNLVGVPLAQGFVSIDLAPLAFRSAAGCVESVHCLAAEASGPKAEGRRRPSRRSPDGSSAGPKTRRAPRQRPQDVIAEFDGQALTSVQSPNEGAPPLDLESVLSSSSPPISSMIPGDLQFQNEIQEQPPFGFCSLDDLFGADLGFSKKFNSDSEFRQELRMAIRQDIFDTTPYYANLSEKAKSVLLLPDSSLEGSWRIPATMDRMPKTTLVLQTALGDQSPTGDEFFQAIGNLCGSKPSTHWIDIFGVQDRKINHSWHLDAGQSPENSRTVLLGFPPKDNYVGCGVFSHLVPLQRECLAPEDHPRLQPVLFAGTVNDDIIVRPRYEPGRELIFYRDIDVLHSAPDVTYRTSIMRFM